MVCVSVCIFVLLITLTSHLTAGIRCAPCCLQCVRSVMHMSILNALPASMTLAPLNDANNGRQGAEGEGAAATCTDTPLPPLLPPLLPPVSSYCRIMRL